jgi:hypothetical protein
MITSELTAILGATVSKGLIVVCAAIISGARTQDEVALLYKMMAREQFESDPELFNHFISGCLSIAVAMKVLTVEVTPGQTPIYRVVNKELIDKDAN